MKKTSIFFLSALLVLSTSCCIQPKEPEVDNVIFLIGDGMGLGAVSTLVMSQEVNGFTVGEPAIGFSETSCANKWVTDSPAGGTALANGAKTLYGRLGMGVDGEDLISSLQVAQTLGKKTGIVVNTVLHEATPASFYANVESRSEGFKIAEQFVESGVDVAIGSGLEVFVNRPDSVDLTAKLIEKGYDVYLDWTSVANTQSTKYVGLLPWSNIHRRNESNVEAQADERNIVCMAAQLAAAKDDNQEELPLDPAEYLEKAVAKGIESLEKDAPNGFYLMIESAIIDGYGHNNDSPGMIEEMNEFNRTLIYLVNYVDKHPNTLLVVTADHETGNTAVTYGSKDEPFSLMFGTKGHTGNLVPLFAYGAGKKHFGRIMHNSDVSPTIEQLMKHE